MRTIKQLEEIVYSSDPFAVEVLSAKPKEKLQTQLQRLYTEIDMIPNTSAEWRQSHNSLIELIEALIELRIHKEEGGAGGISLV